MVFGLILVLGSLGTAPARSISVVGAAVTIPLQMSLVTRISPIGCSFWQKLDGAIDAGFNYTRSSGVAQEMGPLNPYERRIVHLAIAENPGATSESVGDAFMKTVIISAKP